MAVTTEARLREIYGPPSERALAKQLDRLDDHCRGFVAASPFLLLATSDGDGLDVSPKGDHPGFVQVDDAGGCWCPTGPATRGPTGCATCSAIRASA